MKLTHVTIHAGDVLGPSLGTLRIRYSLPLHFRLWLALQLARLAGWVAGVPVDAAPEDGIWPVDEEHDA